MEAFLNTQIRQDSPETSGSTINILPLFGGAAKPLEEMTAAEREQAAEQIYGKAREAAFSRGLPVIISKNGQTVREYADGRTEPVN